MDWSNKEVLTNPNLSYTSRDYTSIYEQLKAAIPLLTKNYEPQDDTDPGIVLIKVMSMLGDMLSFNADNMALEAYPQTVLQTPNAQQIFRLVGYKMKWYRSARCEASFVNQNSVNVTIGRFNTFTSTYDSITYTNMSQIEIPAGASGNAMVTAELVQGRPYTPTMSSSASPIENTGEWHDAYNYNIDASKDIINNRIYLNDVKVDGSTILLVDDDSTTFASLEWKQVDNLNTLTDIGKYFEFDFDENGSPFIQLPDYWTSRYAISRFKLFYVISDGADGEIIDNALTTISQDKLYIAGSTSNRNYLENLHIYNTASTYGYSPETPEEARKNAELFINTIDTLVTCEDFTKAVMRIEGVANALTTDRATDPDKAYLANNQLKIYLIRKAGYRIEYEDGENASELSDDIWIQSVKDAIESYKLAKYDIDVKLENSIDWIDWTIEGTLWMRQPIPADKNHDILVKINDNLDYTFSSSKLDFNEAINYIDVIDNIKASDRMIYHVDLTTAAIQYSRIRRDHKGNPTGESIETRWRIIDGRNNAYTYYYTNGFGCAPTPGGDGSDSGTGFRIIHESGNTFGTGLELDIGTEVYELEIEDNRIYNWTGAVRKPTDYYINQDDETKPYIYKLDPLTGEITATQYYFECYMPIIKSNGIESGEYLKKTTRDANGLSSLDDNYDESTARTVYDIWDSEYNEWTSKFIDEATGEIFILRGSKAYSARRYYNKTSGDILDGFGDAIKDENNNYIRDAVAKEELTGRYEQYISTNDPEGKVFDFYLGQDENGTPLTDSVGNEISAFPIRPNGFHAYVDTDKHLLHDSGSGLIIGSSNTLNGPGSIDYDTGHIKFTLLEKPENPIKIVYTKNTVAMARYIWFDTDKFYTQPQFLKYTDANRSLG